MENPMYTSISLGLHLHRSNGYMLLQNQTNSGLSHSAPRTFLSDPVFATKTTTSRVPAYGSGFVQNQAPAFVGSQSQTIGGLRHQVVGPSSGGLQVHGQRPFCMGWVDEAQYINGQHLGLMNLNHMSPPYLGGTVVSPIYFNPTPSINQPARSCSISSCPNTSPRLQLSNVSQVQSNGHYGPIRTRPTRYSSQRNFGPFSCPKCRRGFQTYHRLRLHLRWHFRIEDQVRMSLSAFRLLNDQTTVSNPSIRIPPSGNSSGNCIPSASSVNYLPGGSNMEGKEMEEPSSIWRIPIIDSRSGRNSTTAGGGPFVLRTPGHGDQIIIPTAAVADMPSNDDRGKKPVVLDQGCIGNHVEQQLPPATHVETVEKVPN